MHQSRIVLSSARALSFCIALVFLLVLAALLQGAHSNTEKEMRGQRMRHKIPDREGRAFEVCLTTSRTGAYVLQARGVLNACTKWQMRRKPRNSVERIAVRTQSGGRQAGRRPQIECTKLQVSGGARAKGSGVGFGAPADPMESRPSVRDVRAQGVAKGQTSGARGDDHRLGVKVPGARVGQCRGR